jgi:hypothetical protein
MAGKLDFMRGVFGDLYKAGRKTAAEQAVAAADASTFVKSGMNAVEREAARRAFLAYRYKNYAKGIGLHAAVGAAVGGGYASYRGDNVFGGAWRGAKYGALAGLGGSAVRNIKNLKPVGRFALSAYREMRGPGIH